MIWTSDLGNVVVFAFGKVAHLDFPGSYDKLHFYYCSSGGPTTTVILLSLSVRERGFERFEVRQNSENQNGAGEAKTKNPHIKINPYLRSIYVELIIDNYCTMIKG